MTLAQDILIHALDLGFGLAGIVPIKPPVYGRAFEAWLAAGYHGRMTYLAAHAELRADPARLAPEARSMILLAANYNAELPPPNWSDPRRGRIARYAWGTDYHEVIKPRLFELDAFIRERSGRTSHGKACVDTVPLLERDYAMQAGLGFIGRNTCLITPGIGSWTFLAALLVPEELDRRRMVKDEGDSPFAIRRSSPVGACGRCTRCLDACPTGAFVAPYVLDARRCISYLTIELRDSIPRDVRSLIGNWVFGCDVCQEVCPYNRAAPVADRAALSPTLDRAAPPLPELLALGESEFRAKFRGTAVMRARRRGLVRNACVAAGNWGDPVLSPILIRLLDDADPLVRAHAAWALGRVGGSDTVRALEEAAVEERDEQVVDELRAARAML